MLKNIFRCKNNQTEIPAVNKVLVRLELESLFCSIEHKQKFKVSVTSCRPNQKSGGK